MSHRMWGSGTANERSMRDIIQRYARSKLGGILRNGCLPCQNSCFHRIDYSPLFYRGMVWYGFLVV
jgi:hypothetical protein